MNDRDGLDLERWRRDWAELETMRGENAALLRYVEDDLCILHRLPGRPNLGNHDARCRAARLLLARLGYKEAAR